LAQAATEREVLIVVRDFAARLDAGEVMRLPPACRPGKFFDAEDVGAYRYELLRHHLSRESASPPVLLQLIEFFGQAGDRLREIMASANDVAEGGN
jgi:hypothetical protein